ncbi:putative transcription regulator A20-like family [Medicago truncatula]|uniref:AN1-like zinc finger protein n=1 Tax=Medicago truncatula TaxID=3880 RepID=A0A072V7E2_MEDTR|nr:zinc finger A20 and AN1 domain-containing stress-associated protein 6-like [Medicago truncatula]KEH37949.1 AN1-like zinc finger protein [Medicago truncatula]RHN74142.1 putative transcription regulator A20-like family [Medicago truncatula]
MDPPPLCLNNCSSAIDKFLCPKCSDDCLTLSEIEGLILGSSPSQNSSILEIDSITVTDTTGKKNNNRCKTCNKRIGLTGFECRCGDVFCGRHRYPETHSCNVDLKSIGRQILAKQNPKCVLNKLEFRV